jgi:NADH dehydrogenase (ubiquinone) Fe-S protein 6
LYSSPFITIAIFYIIIIVTTISSSSSSVLLLLSIIILCLLGHVAVCDGGSGALGHPVEYIQLDTVSKDPAACKYCGLKYKMKAGSHHH